MFSPQLSTRLSLFPPGGGVKRGRREGGERRDLQLFEGSLGSAESEGGKEGGGKRKGERRRRSNTAKHNAKKDRHGLGRLKYGIP